jgi:predicted AlkP superfamily pyrophosphatase or phosphodiesterase
VTRICLAIALGLVACGTVPAAAPAASRPAEAHVVIITVDGLRPDAIAAARATNLSQLVRDGAASLVARAVDRTETLPNHVTMATGLLAARHGVDTNVDLGRELGLPTVFTAVRAAGGRTGLYMGKSKLIALAPGGSADVVRGPTKGDSNWESGTSAALAAKFAEDLPRERFALAWLHLREPDQAGHKQGWMSAPYLDAVREADAALGTILRAIDAAGLRATTTVILTADHGGEAIEHWSHGEVDRLIPWICRGPGARPGAALGVPISADIAPTVLAVLGLPGLPSSDGRAVSGCVKAG